ncbi:RILP-like protein 1 isoform X1 [Engraulis encrasicolus]|uniref:RILP-like protein 1 isoform X1 n=1 Tax=Engraulis encrasicolus TaxID=184585 RepID=UPI002FD28465
MEKNCVRIIDHKQEKTGGCLERTFSTLTVDDVYEIAKLIGSEVEKLIDGYGKESAEGLVPKIVKVLEFLESFAARNYAHKCREEELLKAFETLQIQQQKRQRGKDCEESNNNNSEMRDWQQKEKKWQRRLEEVQDQVTQLRQENKDLQGRIKCSNTQDDRVQRQEREVMLKLKEVVDKQRDEIRAKAQAISSQSKEVEALQEQLDRFMKMNGELRHRQSVMQAQLKSAVERKADSEADMCEKQKEIERLTQQLEKANVNVRGCPLSNNDANDPNRPCFTKQEVRDMIFERNELKANLFLVQEELSYYQREILNDEHCPGFLLDAVRSAIKKQRTVIKAKMLGIAVEDCSSDEDDKGPLFESKDSSDNDTDCTDSRPAESRIRNLFGFLTRSGSYNKSPSPVRASSTWEIINPDDKEPGDDPENRPSPP